MRFQRRQRTTFTKQQLDALNEAFRKNHYPEANYRELLAKTTNLDASRIQVWFQNQRAKDRKRRGLLGDNDCEPDEDHHTLTPNSTNQQQIHHQSCNTILTNQEISIAPIKVRSRPIANHEGSARSICVFSSMIANEAALAVSQGKFANIVEYHQNKYGNQRMFESNGSGSSNNNNYQSSPSPKFHQTPSSLQPTYQQQQHVVPLVTNNSLQANLSAYNSGTMTQHLTPQFVDAKHDLQWNSNWLGGECIHGKKQKLKNGESI